ncbi:hypothetical protein M404DRAFT_809889 [Pisolithus tinctorius Marx 270]|uniref:SPX domain-containing protein n=1 Tax=Pisolithus tinctorius Marx 270 TaxID=870435 RepID=A0A0C3NF09_PISTI|nr:hypothetical protein M404DRAFT_809889 [Pisolithus tinctorius Marx 270]
MLSIGSMTSPSFSQLLPQLSPAQRQFFKLLDADLERVESFFLERQQEAEDRHEKLHEQLEELVAHRQRIYDILPSRNSRVSSKTRFIHMYQRNSTDLRATKSSSVSGRGGELSMTFVFIALSPSRCPPSGFSAKMGKQTLESTKTTYDREYKGAKKKLKKAVVEHYRYGLLMFCHRRAHLS